MSANKLFKSGANTALIKGKISNSEPLSPYTSFRTGGNADFLYSPAALEDLSTFLNCLQKPLPITWLGLGSNTLVRDGGVEGVVIITQGVLNKLTNLTPTLIRAEAGISCAQLARYSARQGLTGLEFLAGIPGTVGGALAMNAGCFGGETWRFIEKVETIDAEGNIKIRPAKDFEIAYRHCYLPAKEWFVAGHFNLPNGKKEVSLQAIRELLEKRNSSQPTGTANCGSVFRNPEGTYAGKLIEEAGLKGKKIGGASVSTKHANFILNEANATSADIENLIMEIQSIIEQKTGILLKPEVCIIGRKKVR